MKNKDDIFKATLEKLNGTRGVAVYGEEEVKKVLNAFIDAIRDALISGESIRFSALGTLDVFDCKERFGRNPQTGETIRLKPHRAVKFRMCKAIKEALKK